MCGRTFRTLHVFLLFFCGNDLGSKWKYFDDRMLILLMISFGIFSLRSLLYPSIPPFLHLLLHKSVTFIRQTCR